MQRHTIRTRLLSLLLLISLILPQLPLLYADDPTADFVLTAPTIAAATYGYSSPPSGPIGIQNRSNSDSAFIRELKLLPAPNEAFELIDLPDSFPELNPNSSSDEVIIVRAKTGLAAGTYTANLVAYYDWNSAGSGDEEALAALSFKVDRATQTAPDAPTLAAKTSSSVTLNAVEGAKAAEYAYHTGDSAPTTGWQDALTFSGLLPNTSYSFFARYPATADVEASAASPALNVTTDEAITPPKPVISAHPTSLRVLEGSDAAFTVGFDASQGYTLQWQVYAPQSEGFVDIPAATSASYIFSKVSYSDNGAKFRAILTESTGVSSSISRVATLNVTPSQALINQDPQSLQVQVGDTAQFQAGFSSVRACSYAWQVKEIGSDAFRNLRDDEAVVTGTVSGESSPQDTATTLMISPVSAAMHSYQYRLLVRDDVAATEAVSSAATLTVSSPSSLIAIQPQRQRVAIGERATFSVELSSAGAYTYQWQVRDATSARYSDIADAIEASYSIPQADADMNGSRYRVQIKAEDSQDILETSSSASLIVYDGANPSFRITENLRDQEVTEGDAFRFHIELADAVSTLVYQWQILEPESSQFVDIDGATGDAYGTTATIDMDGSLFRVFISDTASSHSLYSESAMLSVLYTLPQITSAPRNQRVREGSDATFTASWSAAPPDTEYATEWLIDLPDDELNFIPLSSTRIAYEASVQNNIATLIIQHAPYELDQSLFMLLIRNAADTGPGSRSVNSSAARLEIITGAPTITQQPITQAIDEGQTATFSVQAEGRHLRYQWYVSEDLGHSRNAISGAVSASFTTPTATLNMHGNLYSVEVSNGLESAHSQAAELQVSPLQHIAPVITVEPQDQRVYSGTRAIFSVSATGNPAPRYQWQLSTDGGSTFNDIDQATDSSYQTANTYYAMNGWKYRVVVSNSQGSIVSRAAHLSTYTSSYYLPPNPPNNRDNSSTSSDEIPKLSIGGMEITVSRVNDSRVRLVLSESQSRTLADRRDPVIRFDINAVSDAASVDLPCRVLQRLGSADKSVAFLFDDGSILLSPEAAEFLAGIASSGTANITVQEVNNRSLTSRQRDIVGDKTVFKAELNVNNRTISDLEGAEIELGFLYPLGSSQSESGLRLYHLDDDELRELNSWYDHSERALKTTSDHLSYFVIGYEEPPRVAIDEPKPPRTDIPRETEPQRTEAPSWLNPFRDVKQSDWFYNSLAYVVENKLFVGTSADTFEPNIPMTRGMLVCVLARLDGADLSGYRGSSFSDVALGSYYLSSIEWAFEENIVNGVGNGLFEPDRAISREELMAIFSNYLENRGYELPQQGGQEAFADQAQISAWAAGSVARMQSLGLAGGRGNNLFAPKETATRAEVASLVERFATQLNKLP